MARWNYIKQTKLALYLLGVSTEEEMSTRSKITLFVFEVILILNLYGMFCGGLDKDLSTLTMSLTMSFLTLVMILKLALLHYQWRLHYDEVLEFVDGWYMVENDFSKVFCSIFEASQICCWFIVAWYLGSPVITSALPPAPYRQFWDQDTTLGFIAAYLVIASAFIVMMLITTAVDFNLMTCALGIRNRIENVREKFEEVKSDNDMEILINSVRHHQEILRKLKLFSIQSSPCFFMQIFNTTICSCLCTYAAIKEESGDAEPFLRLSLITIAAYSVMLIYCLIGQKITDSSDDLHFAIYNNLWYKCGADTRRILHVVLTFTGRPVEMSGSFVVKMSLRTFYSVTKESYSYLMVLMRITNKL